MRLIPVVTVAPAMSTLLLLGCATPPPVESHANRSHRSGRRVELWRSNGSTTLFERFFEDELEYNPVLATFIGDHRYDDRLPNSIGPEYIAAARAMNQRYLDEIRTIDPEQLAPAERISYDIFLSERLRSVASDRFPIGTAAYQPDGQPADPDAFAGFGHECAAFCYGRRITSTGWAGSTALPSGWTRQSSTCAKVCVAGVVQPRPVMEKVLPQLDAMIVPNAVDSQYYAPIEQFPDSFSAADRERLTAAYTQQARNDGAAGLSALA